MAFEPIASGEVPNLVDVAKRMDPDGSIADIAEMLAQYNPIVYDIPMLEGNLPTGHEITVRSDLPTPTWRFLNQGVRDTMSRTEQYTETCGMLEDYGEVDKDVANLNGNTQEFRLSEDEAHIEGMSNEMASMLFYGDTVTDPNKIKGLAPRYASLTLTGKPTAITPSDHLKNVISLGGTGSYLTSLWYIQWGPATVFGIYPKGSKAGLVSQDLGEVTLFDSTGGKFQGYRTHYQWKTGVCVKDWRYIVRICNIDLSKLDDAATQKSLYHAMIKAKHAVPSANKGRGVFYCGAAVAAMLDIAAVEKANAALGMKEVFGQEVLTFRGTPIRQCDAILEAETVIS